VKRFLVAGLLSCGLAHFAFGATGLELELTDGTNTALINSSGTLVLTGSASGAATLSGPGNSVYSFTGSVGNYTVNVSTGESSPLLPIGSLDLNTVDTASGATSGPLNIEWSENGITSVFSAWAMTWGGTLDNPITAGSCGATCNVAYTAYESNTNGFFAMTNAIGMIGPQTSGVVMGMVAGAVPGVTAPYSLTEVITLNGVGATNYSGNASLTAVGSVPEPATVFLFGGAVLAVATILRRKFANKA
jgi:PEP-CTERM motif